VKSRKPGAARVRRALARDKSFVHRDEEVPARAISRMIREGDILVAEAGGRRAGLARLEYIRGKTPFLTSLWIEPDMRRRGVATALIDHHACARACRGPG
jgi:N-acetylglutamate synthase-like GNAT family acetyltransferase